MLASIEKKISELEGGAFQKLVDYYVYAEYGKVTSPGSQLGTYKTTPGTPDSYINEKGEYTFIEISVQKPGVFRKIKDDINKCFEASKEVGTLSKILYFYTAHPLSVKKSAELFDQCKEQSCQLELIDISILTKELYKKYPHILRDELGIEVDTGQIVPINEFIANNDKKKSSTSYNLSLIGREDELKKIVESIGINKVTLVFGVPGIGKTRLALEACREFNIKYRNCEVYGIKSNDLELYEDYKRYFSHPGYYLVLVDDANQITSLKYLLEYIRKEDSGIFLKIVATVRDYAKKQVIERIQEFTDPGLIKVGLLNEDNIREIAQNNYGIKNNSFIDRIVQIAKGNARLACIACKVSIETNSFMSIYDASQLLKTYYDTVLKEIELSDDALKIITCIYLLNGIHFEDQTTMKEIFDLTHISAIDLLTITKELHRNEICDFCEDIAVKPSDQILSCYLSYLTLFDKKVLRITEVLNHFFSKNNSMIINGINGIVNYYRNDNVMDYLKGEVDITWRAAEYDEDLFNKYFIAFHTFRPETTLLTIKDRISKLDAVNYEGDYSINKYSTIKQEIELEILAGYANTEYANTAIELVFFYAEKRRNQFENIISILTNSNYFGINENSSMENYRQQIFIADKAIEKTDKFCEVYFTNLFFKLAKYYIEIAFEYSRFGYRYTFHFGEIALNYNDGSVYLRGTIWNELLSIYKTGNYKKQIQDILQSYKLRSSFIRDLNLKDFALFDYQYIIKLKKYINFNSFIEVKLFYKLLLETSKHGVNISNQIRYCKNNNSFALYYWLLGEKYRNFNYLRRKELKNRDINKSELNFTTKDYMEILNSWSEIDLNYSSENYEVNRKMLDFMFTACNNLEVDYLLILKLLLDINPRFSFGYNILFRHSINIYGLDKIDEIVRESNQRGGLFYTYSFLYSLEEKEINEQYLTMLNDYISQETNSSSNYNIQLSLLRQFYNKDNMIFISTVNNIAKADKLFKRTIPSLFNDFEPLDLIKYFKNDLKVLNNLFIKLLDSERPDLLTDFIKCFIEYNVINLEEYIQIAINEISYGKRSSLLEELSCLWELKNYKELIEKAFLFIDRMVDKDYLKAEFYRNIFTIKNNNLIMKQDEWVENYISKNSTDIVKITGIFEVVRSFPISRKLYHIKKVLILNKSFELFKQLPLESNSFGWSGSEIPIIDNRIDFFETIKKLLDGIDFIEHKAYIADTISRLEKYKKKRSIEEFLRDY